MFQGGRPGGNAAFTACLKMNALSFGIVSSAVPLHFLYRWLLGDRYAEYTHYGNLRVGFDSWKVFRWMAIVFGIGCVRRCRCGRRRHRVRTHRDFLKDRVVAAGAAFDATDAEETGEQSNDRTGDRDTSPSDEQPLTFPDVTE